MDANMLQGLMAGLQQPEPDPENESEFMDAEKIKNFMDEHLNKLAEDVGGRQMQELGALFSMVYQLKREIDLLRQECAGDVKPVNIADIPEIAEAVDAEYVEVEDDTEPDGNNHAESGCD